MRMSTTRLGALLGSLAFTLSALATEKTSDEKTTDEEIAKLKEQILKLSQKVEQLDRDDGNSALSGIAIGGRIQLDYNLYEGAYNADNEGNNGSDFFARRVRLFAEKEDQDWDYKLLLDFAEGGAEIIMARLRYQGFNGGPAIKAGKIREDISLEALTSSKHITTIERSTLANTFSPFFRWGVSAYQYYPQNGLRYALGVYKNDAFGDSGQDSDNDLNFATSGRLTWAPVHNPGRTLHLGLWGSYREMSGDTLSSAFARGEVRQTSVRLVNYAAGGEPVAVDDLTQYGLELAGQWDALSLQAEYARRSINTVDSVSALDGEDFDGYYLMAGYFLTGESREYKASSAVFGQPKQVRNAWEVYGRMSNMDASSATQGTDVTTYTLGASYYYSPEVKFMVNIIRSEVEGPGTAALVNDNEQGNALSFRVRYLF